MSKRLRLSKRPVNRSIRNFTNRGIMLDNSDRFQNVLLKKSVVTSVTNSVSPAIIRIVPATTKNVIIPRKEAVKTYIVQQSENIKSVNIPSSSTVEITDHAYLCKSEQDNSNPSDEYDGFEDITNGDMITTDSFPNKVQTQKSVDTNIEHQTESNAMSTSEILNKPHSEQCCCSCRETLEIILQKQQEILNCLQNSRYTFYSDKKLDLLPAMPFKDINDFLDFDESLTNENVQDQFIIKLKKLLVSTEQKSISNIMASIVTNELCRQISWIGIKNTVAFSTTTMVTLIVDLIQEHHEVHIDAIRSRIAEWLRRCGDRIGNEIRKINKKKAQLGLSV